jgi:hypothetical protein
MTGAEMRGAAAHLTHPKVGGRDRTRSRDRYDQSVGLFGTSWESGGSGARAGVHRMATISAGLATFNLILHPQVP